MFGAIRGPVARPLLSSQAQPQAPGAGRNDRWERWSTLGSVVDDTLVLVQLSVRDFRNTTRATPLVIGDAETLGCDGLPARDCWTGSDPGRWAGVGMHMPTLPPNGNGT